jgi:hypothetical protein
MSSNLKHHCSLSASVKSNLHPKKGEGAQGQQTELKKKRPEVREIEQSLCCLS